MLAPVATVRQTEIKDAVQSVEDALKPDVLRIRYDIGEDWKGDWAITFRIILSDEAAEKRLRSVAKEVASNLAERLDFVSLGVYPYHSFRSQSEQAVLKEKDWA